jgi:aspartate aminotransferase-like enzyme
MPVLEKQVADPGTHPRTSEARITRIGRMGADRNEELRAAVTAISTARPKTIIRMIRSIRGIRDSHVL